MQKSKRTGRLDARPQITNTPMVEPIVESRMHVVTRYLSMMVPMNTQPKTEATLKMMTVRAESAVDAPSVRA